jgi:hypothetical protein
MRGESGTKGNISSLTLTQQIGITMPLSSTASDTLQKLLQMDPADLALNRDELAKLLGISRPTLLKRLAELMGAGYVRNRDSDVYHSSGIAIIDCDAQLVLPGKPAGFTSKSIGQTVPRKVTIQVGSMPPPFKIPPQKAKAKAEIPVSGNSLPSVGKGSDANSASHALSTALPSEPPDCLPRVKLDGQDVTPNQVYSNTFAGKLSPAAKATLVGWKKNPYRGLWFQAFLRAIGDRIKNQWADRVGHRKIAANANGTPEKWKQIALTVLALDVEPDYFLDVAFDCCPKRFAYPTVSFLASEFLKSSLPAWVPKDQRGNAQLEEPIEEIMKRSREAIDWAEAHNPAPVPNKMWFVRNWPGLWGRQDNRRPVSEEGDLEP